MAYQGKRLAKRYRALVDEVTDPALREAVESVGADRVRLAIQSGGISVSAEVPDTGPDDGAPSLEVRTRDGVTSGRSGGFRVQLEEETTRAEAVAFPADGTAFFAGITYSF